jgi:hypothetical protein
MFFVAMLAICLGDWLETRGVDTFEDDYSYVDRGNITDEN